MMLDWENLIDDLNGEHCWGNWVWENCSDSKRNLGDFSNRGCMSVSWDCFAALSRPRSCVPTILVSLKDWTFLKNIVMCLTICTTQIVNLRWIDLVNLCSLFYL